MIYFPTFVARYSLFVLKVPLYPKQTNNQGLKQMSQDPRGKVKGKVDHASQENVGACYPPPLGNVCDACPVQRQTSYLYLAVLLCYLSSLDASPFIGWYQIMLLGDGMETNVA